MGLTKIPFDKLQEYAAKYIDPELTCERDGIVIAPKASKFYQWENFNTSNPTVLRLKGAKETYLGYRAGGSDGKHIVATDYHSWASELGLAVLSSDMTEVLYRFPLSIFRPNRKVALPKTNEEFYYIRDNQPEEEIAYHDFRLWSFDDGYIHLYYHKGWMSDVEDCILKMAEGDFLNKIALSKALIDGNRVTEQEWYQIWRHEDWLPAGCNGTESFYASALPKNNIDVYRLKGGSLHCTHRPAPDNAILSLEGKTYIPTTADGIVQIGELETCVRVGGFDNSHLGSNGTETPVVIDGQDWLLDISHGVHNLAFDYTDREDGEMFYLPFFRLKDAETGEVMYLSRSPVVTVGEEWKEYAYDGNWVSILDNFCYTMFPGGQYPAKEKKNTEKDVFYSFTGVGDTAVGRLKFRPKDLLPQRVRGNLANYREFKRKTAALDVPENKMDLSGKFCGDWDFSLCNVNNQMSVCYHLKNEKVDETHVRPVHRDADCFDFNMTLFDGKSLFYDEELGYLAVYQGVTFEKKGGKDISKIGYGVMILHQENPSRILYRSYESVLPVKILKGIAFEKEFPVFTAEQALSFLPDEVKRCRKRMRYLEPKGLCYPSTHTAWLKDKSAGVARNKPGRGKRNV